MVADVESPAPTMPPPFVAPPSSSASIMTPSALYDMMCSEYESRSQAQAAAARPVQLSIILSEVSATDMDLLLL